MRTIGSRRSAKLLTAFAVMALVTCCFSVFVTEENDAITRIYVDATDGLDTNNGASTSLPVKTLKQALTLVDEEGQICLMTDASVDSPVTVDRNVTIMSDSTSMKTLDINAAVTITSGKTLTLGTCENDSTYNPVEVTFGTGGSFSASGDIKTADYSYIVVSPALAVSDRYNQEGVNLMITGNITLTDSLEVLCNILLNDHTISDVYDASNPFILTLYGELLNGTVNINNADSFTPENLMCITNSTVNVNSTVGTDGILRLTDDDYSPGDSTVVKFNKNLTVQTATEITEGSLDALISASEGKIEILGDYVTGDTDVEIRSNLTLIIAEGKTFTQTMGYLTVYGSLLSNDPSKPVSANVINIGFVSVNKNDSIGPTISFSNAKKVAYSESAMSELKSSGELSTVNSSSKLTINGNSTISSGNVCIIYGKLTIPSGITLTIKAGGHLVFACTENLTTNDISGKILMEHDSSSSQPMMTLVSGFVSFNSDNNLDGKVVIGGTGTDPYSGLDYNCPTLDVSKDKTLTFGSKSNLSVDASSSNINHNGTIRAYGSIVFNGSVEAQRQVSEIGGPSDICGIKVYGNVLFDSSVGSKDVHINMSYSSDSSGEPSVAISKYSVGNSTSSTTAEGTASAENTASGTMIHSLSISDSYMYLARNTVTENVVYMLGNTLTITPKAVATLTGSVPDGTTVASGTAATWSGVVTVAGLTISESIEKVDTDASDNTDSSGFDTSTFLQYYQHMSIKGNASVTSSANAVWTSTGNASTVNVVATYSAVVSIDADINEEYEDKNDVADVVFSGVTIGGGITLGLGSTIGVNAIVDDDMRVNGNSSMVASITAPASASSTSVLIYEDGEVIIGTYVDASTNTVLESTKLNGTKYSIRTANGSTVTSIHYADVNNAINDADGKMITTLSVYGEQSVTQNLKLVAGTTLESKSDSFTIGTSDNDSIRLDIAENAKVTGNIDVLATLFANNASNLSGATITSDVKSQSTTDSREGWVKYNSLAVALNGATNETIRLTRNSSLYSSTTIPSLTSLYLESYTLTLDDGVTLTVDGTLNVGAGDVIASAFTLSAQNTTSNGGKFSAAVVVNGTVDSDSQLKYTGGTAAVTSAVAEGATTTPASLVRDGAPIAGAYYELSDGGYELASVDTATSDSGMDLIKGTATIYGANSVSSIVITGGDTYFKKVALANDNVTVDGVEISNSLVADSVTIDGVSFEIPSNATFSGNIDTYYGTTIVAKSVSGLTVTDTGGQDNPKMKLSGTITCGSRGSISLTSGTAYMDTGFVLTSGSDVTTFTVGEGATLSVADSLNLSGVGGAIVVAGTLNVPNGASLSAGSIQVTGTLNVESTLTVDALYAGITESDIKAGKWGNSQSLNISGITATRGYVAGDSEMSMSGKKTTFIIEGTTWFTAYGITDFTLPTRAPLQNKVLESWTDGSTTYKSGSSFDIGSQDTLTANINSKIYTLVFLAESGVNNIYLNENLWVEDYSYSSGTYAISWAMKAGYSDNLKIEVIDVPAGMTATVDGKNLTLSGVASSGTGTGEIKVQLVRASNDSSSSSGGREFQMTDILMVALVLVIVVMGIMVAIRFIKH